MQVPECQKAMDLAVHLCRERTLLVAIVSRSAQFALVLNIPKKAPSLKLPQSLRYFRMARRVHGFLIPFFAILALGSAVRQASSLRVPRATPATSSSSCGRRESGVLVRPVAGQP